MKKCIEAEITYDFNLNKVTVNETVFIKDFSERTYTLYTGTSQSNDKLNPLSQMEYVENYNVMQEDRQSPAFVYTYAVDSKITGDYYWNIRREDGTWVLASPGKDSYNTRSQISWHNVVIYPDESTKSMAVNSEGFRVEVGSDHINMTKGEDYIASATVSFDSIKKFRIKFGSVNSNKLMSDPLTHEISVSENCTQAFITYDFNLNKVTVEENPTSSVSLKSAQSPIGVSTRAAVDFQNGNYTLYAGDKESDLKEIGKLTYTSDFRKIGTDSPISAFVITHDISASYKDYYYWNIKDANDDSWMLPNNKSIKFSNSKSETSWHTIALLEDGTTSDVAAHSKGFRFVQGGNATPMNSGNNHTASITAYFPNYDKEYQINYGSVNSSSDMGGITPSLEVSSKCLEANIVYDFSLNKVTVTETKTGDPSESLKVTQFSVVPAVAPVGKAVTGKIFFNMPCQNLKVNCKKLSGSSVNIAVTAINPNEYEFILDNTTEGIYNLSLSYSDGASSYSNMNPLDVRIVSATGAKDKDLTVNAYEDIDWNTIGRFKANFHTHTSQSFDTQYTTTQVVDKYQTAGYKILALTDHDANPYPWSLFSLYNPDAQDRDASSMGMLSIPGNELSKDRRNNWSESTGGEFNHHNDFFTGRKGQEFMSLRESYAYSQAIGGLQIINHPGQYWNLSTEYKNGEKNSPEWHAANFNQFESLVGLEVYNQGNRRPNDRILWDQVLTLTMPERPVWGYSCDDTHTEEQYFRNYQYMLMPTLSTEDLKDAMRDGSTIFSYEFTGSGKAKAPAVNSIQVDKENHTIYIDTDNADNIEWIYSTYRSGSSASTTKSAIVGYGKSFDYSGYQGSYVRARLTNAYGETATQPFGFTVSGTSSAQEIKVEKESGLRVINIPGQDEVTLICTDPMLRISVFNSAGSIVRYMEVDNLTQVSFSKSELSAGLYVIVVATPDSAYTAKFMR